MKHTRLLAAASLLVVTTLVTTGAGCTKSQGDNTNGKTNTNQSSNDSMTGGGSEPATVNSESLGEPTGDVDTDQAAAEDVVNQMQDASDQASSYAEDVESGEDVDTYELNQNVND